MILTEESMLVQLWIKWIKKDIYTREQVPNLSNLREMVFVVLDG